MKHGIVKYLVCGAVTLHLFLVTLNAAYIKLSDALPFRNLINFYAKASGANSSYGFFAPSIGTKTRAMFDVTDRKGVVTSNVGFSSEMNREENIRLGGIFDEFMSEEADDDEFRKPLASSLAAAVFSRYADTASVTLYVQEFMSISMADYRNGKRAEWEEIYKAKFIRTLDESVL